MVQQNVTGFICTVPSLTREYVSELQRSGHAPYAPMKAWGIGGESAPVDVVRQMQEAFPNLIGPVNMYGPTEVTAVTVQHVFPKEFIAVAIGRPDPNVHAYVVDSALRPVPVGVPGELVLSGPRLALGYVGRPDLTEEKFVPNPCLELVSGRLESALAPYYKLAYRTGDLVRWRGDGTIDFMGRIDRQVKITGVRIELGEVEAALEGAEGVSQAVAAAVPDPSGQKRLVGYVTPGDANPTAVVLHCRSVLVPAMVPSVVVPLDAFPLMPNGKVDVSRLPAPDWSGGGSEEFVAPVDDVEAGVLRVFAEVLGRSPDELSMLADFFAAGGTSLQAMQIATKLRNAFDIFVSGDEIIRSPTPIEVSLAVKGKLTSGASDADNVKPTAWPDNIRPASSGQESLFLTYLLDPTSKEVWSCFCFTGK